MIQAARERIQDLFSLAETEVRQPTPELSRRYVALARRIGMRYNVRPMREYRDRYCRGCSTFWVEGRTLRTRFRGGLRVQTCLGCGRVRRVRLRPGVVRSRIPEPTSNQPVLRSEGALVEDEIEAATEEDVEEEQ